MFKSLNHFQKFQAGADLWILFYEPHRKLFKKINWRTGFLLKSFADSEEISKSILLNTYTMFPNKQLLCLPLNFNLWVEDIYRHWKNLKKPSLRVFLPLQAKEEELNLHGFPFDLFCNLSYYSETRNEFFKKS